MTPAQQRGVSATGHAAIVATAGAGKTHTMVERTAHLLNALPESRVLNVSFTRGAADEMQRRVAARVDPAQMKRCANDTFHRFSIVALRRAGMLAEKIVSYSQRMAVIGMISGAFALRFEDEAAAIGNLDEHLGLLLLRLDQAGLEKSDKWLVQQYRTALARDGLIDLSDVLLRYVELLCKGVIAPYRATHIHVDEFQDTDAVQLEWLFAHIRNGATATIVGDDDQSLYSWRKGLGYAGFRRFVEETSAEQIVLDTNFRSKSEIVERAGQLIANNTSRIAKTFTASRGPGADISLLVVKDSDEEADLAARAAQMPGGVAILARNNDSLREVERTLLEREIEFTRLGRSAIASDELNALLVLLDSIVRGTSIRTIDWLSVFIACGAPAALCAGFTGTTSIMSMHQMPNTARLALQNLAVLVAEQRENPRSTNPDELLAVIGLAVQEAMERVHSATHRQQRLARATREVNRSLRFLSRLTGPLDDRIRYVRRQLVTNQEEDAPASQTSVGTIHGAKGLEWGTVLLLGIEDGVLPASTGVTNLAEERRIFFVGMTRARDRLIVCFRRGFMSPFVREAFPEAAEQADAGIGEYVVCGTPMFEEIREAA